MAERRPQCVLVCMYNIHIANSGKTGLEHSICFLYFFFSQTLAYFEQLKSSADGWKICAQALLSGTARCGSKSNILH